MRKLPTPEKVFYDSLYNLIKKSIVEYKKSWDTVSKEVDIKNKGNYILEKMEDWKHLLFDFEGDKNDI